MALLPIVFVLKFEEELTDTDDNDESLNSENEVTEQELAPESGGASGENSVPDIIDKYVTHPLAADLTEAQQNVNLLRTIVPAARPPPQQQQLFHQAQSWHVWQCQNHVSV